MSEGPIWFEQKRFGLGARPVSWQGWALTCGFTALIIATTARLAHRPAVLAAILVPAVIIFLVVCAKTTRGGWRWRQGDDS